MVNQEGASASDRNPRHDGASRVSAAATEAGPHDVTVLRAAEAVLNPSADNIEAAASAAFSAFVPDDWWFGQNDDMKSAWRCRAQNAIEALRIHALSESTDGGRDGGGVMQSEAVSRTRACRIAELEAERDRLAAALRDFALHGTRHDITPTHGPGGLDYLAYIRSMDAAVRSAARRALEESSPASCVGTRRPRKQFTSIDREV